MSNSPEYIRKLDHSYIAGGNVEWYNHSGKQSDSFSKRRIYNYCAFPGFYFRGEKKLAFTKTFI
jgi:hypothetical protein